MTHRQFLTWIEWLGQEWNKPSRADHYAAQVANEIHQIAGYLGVKQSKDFDPLMKFGPKVPDPEANGQADEGPKDLKLGELTENMKRRIAWSKGAWRDMMTIDPSARGKER